MMQSDFNTSRNDVCFQYIHKPPCIIYYLAVTGCNLSDTPGLFSGIQTDEAPVRIGYRDWIKERADDDATLTLISRHSLLIKMEADV